MNPESERPKFKQTKAGAALAILLHAPLVFAEPEPTSIINEITLISEAPIALPVPKLENITEFYKDFSEQEKSLTSQFYFDTLGNSNSAKDYFAKLNQNAAQLNSQQKIYFLQQLGQNLAATGNYEMQKNNQHIEVSDEEMFEALKNNRPSGICANIHTFMVKAAENLGLEAWLQGGFIPEGGHTWMGAIAEKGGKKEIVFVDYDALIPTGTLNYQEALGIMERRNQEIALFSSPVGNTKEILFPIKSQAQEIMEKAAGFEDISQTLPQKLEAGKIERQKRKLEVKLSPEATSIKFTIDGIGFYFLNYQDLGNPYNSLAGLNAIRNSLQFGTEQFDIEGDLTLMHLNIRDLGTKLFPRDTLVGRLVVTYIASNQLIKGDYGQLALNYGATIESGEAYFFKIKGVSEAKFSGNTEGGLGIRLAYLNPNETGKIFLGIEGAWQSAFNDFQNQGLTLKEIFRRLVIGGEYKARKGTTVNLETSLAQLDYGQSYSVKAGLVDDPLKLKISWLKDVSQYEQLQPSKDLLEGLVGFQFPIGEINFFGTIGQKKYKDAEPEKVQNIGLKLKIIL